MKTKSKNSSKLAKLGAIAMSGLLVMGAAGGTISASANIDSTLDVNKRYSGDYDSIEEILEAGKELNYDIAAEGFVLLKNKDNALPLAKSERKVTVLGESSVDMAFDGGGSGAQGRPGNDSIDVATEENVNIFDSLDSVGIEYNKRVKSRYENMSVGSYNTAKYMDKCSEGETGVSEYGGTKYKNSAKCVLDGAEGTFGVYKDAAILIFSRSGAENADLSANHVAGHSDTSEHELTLNDSEKELMAYAKMHFKKIIVLLNSPSVMEVGDMQNDDAVSAILWIGLPGWNGAEVIGPMLTGAINPSGRTVDFWMNKFTSDPTWYNFGDYSQARYALTGDDGYDPTKGKTTVLMGVDESTDITNTKEYAVDYAEGIFMGYRYYETAAVELGDKGEEWYQRNTVYPFGYGLSYTTFSKKIVDIKGDLTKADGKLTVKVEVKNTGNIAGKEVVQIYATSPYTAGGIDKAAVDLVGFGKTGMLNPGKSQTVEVEFAVKDLASFDYDDRNKNNFCGYELEAGDYIISLRDDSHNVLDSKTLSCTTALNWDEDGNPETPNNIYSQAKDSKWGASNTLANNWTVSGEDHYLTRDKVAALATGLDGDATAKKAAATQLAWLLGDDNEFIAETFYVLESRTEDGIAYKVADKDAVADRDWDNVLTAEAETDYKNLWTKSEEDIPTNWTQGAGTLTNGRYPIQLYSMLGKSYDDEGWDALINQLTVDEMKSLINNGSFVNPGLESIGKPALSDDDGPIQTGRYADARGWAWVCSPTTAATYNEELAYEQGRIVGNETLFMKEVNKKTGNQENGWYGPALNTHRSPLTGRNFEYYSQDGIHGGKIAAAVVKGATDMGCHVYAKHFFLNDQETNRRTTATFATEQAIRQIYAKQFELTVKEGNANGLMLSLNLIGIDSNASYTTSIQLLTNEWGFDGLNNTDMKRNTGSGWSGYQLIRGLCLPLGDAGKLEGEWDATLRGGKGGLKIGNTVSYTQWYWLREYTKRCLYTTVNGNGMKNGYDSVLTVAEQTKTVKQGQPLSDSIFNDATLAKLDSVFGVTGYTVTAQGLPKGVTVNSDGMLKGSTAQTGEYDITVSIKGKDGLTYISDTVANRIKLKVESSDAFKINTQASATGTVGTEFSGSITQNLVTFTTANYENGCKIVGKYNKVTCTASGLPAGLKVSVADDATSKLPVITIAGTPTEAGTFNVVLTLTAAKVTGTSLNSYGSLRAVTENENYGGVVTITVSGTNVTLDWNYASGGTKVIGGATSVEGSDVAAVKAPDRGDIKFKGWSLTPDGEVIADLGSKTYTEATTLYAVWEYPLLSIIDGYWYIGGENTGYKATGLTGAAGADGQNGADGADGLNGISIIGFEKVSSENNVDTYKFTLSDGTEYEYSVTNGTNGKDGTNGTNGKDGEQGPKGDPGENGSGCGGSIVSTSIAACLALAGVAAVVLLKKKEQ